MKRAILGKCCLATLCALSLTGFAGSATTTAVTASESAKTIEDLRVRVEKLELFSAARTIPGDGNEDYYLNMPFVIKLSHQGNRFADQWLKSVPSHIDTNSLHHLITVAQVYSSDPDADVRDKVKALHYAMTAYSLATNRIGLLDHEGQGVRKAEVSKITQNALEALAVAEAAKALAAAYAINGDYKKAIESEEKAMAIISQNAKMAKYLEPLRVRDSISSEKKERIELYKKGLPYIREKWNLPVPELGSEH